MLEDFAYLAVAGFQAGCIYAVLALSYYVVMTSSGILNFAQGEWMMVAAVSGVVLIGAGVPPLLSLPLSIAAAGLASVATERLFIAPLVARRASVDILVVALLGIMIVVRYGVGTLFGHLERPLASPVGATAIVIADVLPVQSQTILIFVTTLLVFTAYSAFTRWSWIGVSMRVTAIDPVGAQLCGVNPVQTRVLAFALAGILAGICGWLYAPLFAAGNLIGVLPGIKGFVALVIGGLASPIGSLIGGLFLGVIEVSASYFLSSVYADAIGFSALLVILLIWPSGLTGGGRVR